MTPYERLDLSEEKREHLRSTADAYEKSAIQLTASVRKRVSTEADAVACQALIEKGLVLFASAERLRRTACYLESAERN